jgi:addiction module HigA family antidote
MTKLLEEIHPGEILLHELMIPMGISAIDLAEKTQISVEMVEGILEGRESITHPIATALKIVFPLDASFWMNLQSEYDLRINQLAT